MISKQNCKKKPREKKVKKRWKKPQFRKAQQRSRESAKKLNHRSTLMKKLIKS